MTMRIREISGTEGFEGLDSASAQISYLVWDDAISEGDTLSVDAMRSAVLAVVPATYLVDGVDLQLDRLSREYLEDSRKWLWTADYNFKIPESLLTLGFDTQGGTVNLQFAPTDRYGANAPNFQGGINYKAGPNGDGEFAGVEKVIPALKLNFRYRWPKNTVSTAYVNSLAAMTGTTNLAAWQGYDAGELLFLGATGEIIPGKPTEIDYHMAASANATLTIGSIAGIAKAGHRYLWIAWEDDEDTAAKRLIKSPLGVYVSKIYDESSFTGLGIG